MSRLPVLIMMSMLAAAPRASAACRWFGTQIECDGVVIGTQAAEEPSRARSLPILPLHGEGGLADGHATSRHPLEIHLQDFGADPRFCRKIGNETYCY
jgi:hypothetical protein